MWVKAHPVHHRGAECGSMSAEALLDHLKSAAAREKEYILVNGPLHYVESLKPRLGENGRGCDYLAACPVQSRRELGVSEPTPTASGR